MGEPILFPEYRDELRESGYPFEPAATRRNAAGASIPPGLFLDASFYPVGGRESGYLARVDVAHGRVALTIGDAGNPARATGAFDPTAPPEVIAFSDDLGRPAGLVVSEPARLAVLTTWGLGTHAFTAAQASFVAAAWRPAPAAGLGGLLLDDGSLLTGEIWLVGEDGVALTADRGIDPVSGEGVLRVHVNFVGDALYRRGLCADSAGFITPRFVRTLRVVSGPQQFDVRPDRYGHVKVAVAHAQAADSVLRVRSTAAGLVLEAAGAAGGA